MDGKLPCLNTSNTRAYSPSHLQAPDPIHETLRAHGEWKESPVRFDRDSMLSNGADGFVPFAGSKQDSNRAG